MTLHHMINSDQLEAICPYCLLDLSEEDWISEFLLEFHYKTHFCKCGKKISIKIEFHGSGHDNWRKETNLAKINNLDDLKKIA